MFLDEDVEMEDFEAEDVIEDNFEEEDLPAYIKMDYSLKTPEERSAKVQEIIANTPSERLTQKYIDKLAEYIIKPETIDERKRKNSILTTNRMVTVNERETSYEGLVGKLENGEDGLYNMIINDKNVLLTPKTKITQEEIDTIPGLKELVEAIKVTEREAKLASGRKKFLLIKQLKQMRQDQYVLRNAFKQPIYSKSTIKAIAKLDLSEEITMDKDGNIHSTGCINFFNPDHVMALLCNYNALKNETWDKFSSDMKWMLIDFEKLVKNALQEKYPYYYDLLVYKLEDRQNAEIKQLLFNKYGIDHTVEYISALWRNKIPKLIVEQAENEWLDFHFTQEEKGKWKRCSRCGQIKLAHNRFFSKNSTSKDGFYSICKCCRNKKK